MSCGRDGLKIWMFWFVGFSILCHGFTGTIEHRKLGLLKPIAGHLHLLRECRRQITFVASVAIGAFVNKIIKDSPLSPLPLPPLADPPKWSFFTLPLHMATPHLQWMLGPQPPPVYLNQGQYDRFPMLQKRSLTVSDEISIRWQEMGKILHRHLSRTFKPTRDLIFTAVNRTMRSWKSDASEDVETRQWLLRWCH